MIMLLSIGYLLDTKSCTWRTEINDTKIRNLKIEIWCMHLCVVLSFDISNIDYIRCTWLKYQRFMPTEIKTTLTMSHTIFIQPRSVATILLDFCVRSCTCRFTVWHHASGCIIEFLASNQFLFKHYNYMQTNTNS